MLKIIANLNIKHKYKHNRKTNKKKTTALHLVKNRKENKKKV